MKLKQKIAIITGAKSGIGFATSERFIEEGALVILADIFDAHQETNELKKFGAEICFIQVDVGDESSVSALISQTINIYGRLDILVNNAGIELAKTIPDTTIEDWDMLMNVNLKGVFLCSKAAVPIMKAQHQGVIVNVASELGLVGGSEIAAYSASKGGVIQLTKSMAIDHAADGIRINCIAPGPVSTPLLESIINNSSNPKLERQKIIEKTLLKRFGQPEEIANVIAFLASYEASFMTGSIITVDGGWTAH